MNNINDSFIKYFKNIWEKEISIFKNYVDNNQLFEDIWLSAPKFSQLKKILSAINEYNKNILENSNNNNNSKNEIAKYKNDRDRVIRNFWRNFIFDKDILEAILQQNDIKLLELINEMLNRKEVIDYNIQGVYLYYIDQTKENLNDKKITKKQVKDCYFNYVDVYHINFLNSIKFIEQIFINNKNDVLKTTLDLLKLNLKNFEENSIKYKSDNFIQNNIFPNNKIVKFNIIKYK